MNISISTNDWTVQIKLIQLIATNEQTVEKGNFLITERGTNIKAIKFWNIAWNWRKFYWFAPEDFNTLTIKYLYNYRR